MVTNKNAATEDDVGYLHGALNRLFKAKVEALQALIEEDPASAAFLIQGKDLQVIAKWISDNGITATPADMQKANELTDQIAKLKAKSAGRVIPFVKEA